VTITWAASRVRFMAVLRKVTLEDLPTAPVVMELEQSIAAPRTSVCELLSGIRPAGAMRT